MDQIELLSEVPIGEWNRKKSPVTLMKQVFLDVNRKKLKDFYDELFVSIHLKERENDVLLWSVLKQAKLEYEIGNYTEAVALLTQIIRNASHNSMQLKEALTLRSKIYMITCFFKQAVIDYELYMKELSETGEQQLSEMINLIECYFALGCYKKVQDYLLDFKRIYDMHFHGNNAARLNGLKGKYENLIKMIENGLLQMKYKRMLPKMDGKPHFEPYLGFNKNQKIIHSSNACSLVTKTNRQMIISNHSIPKGKIVAVESPYLRQQFGRALQCDNCFLPNKASIPCFDCHFKSYCSHDCKILDKNLHKFECIGYKFLILPMLKCELLFRLLIQCLVLLKDSIFYQHQICQSKSALELYDNLQKVLATMPHNILNNGDIIGYDKFPPAEYELMVLNSFRLTIFITQYTNLIPDFFSDLKADKEEIEIFLATLILTLSAKIVTTSFRINTKIDGTPVFTTDSKETKFNSDIPSMPFHYNRNIFKFFGFDKDKLKSEAALKIREAFVVDWDHRSNVDKTNDCDGSSNKVEIVKIINDIVNKWKDVSTFDNGEVPSVLGLYLTTLKFNHSCDPNLRLIYLSSGILLVKASRDIKPGEHLTISYGCHYKQADYNTRLACTNKFNISCLCDYCNGKFNPHFPENVLCIKCKSLVSPSEAVCVACNQDMIKTSMVYKHLIWELEHKAYVTGDDRQTFHDIVLPLMVYEDILPPTNHVFIQKLLLFTEFLTSRNFAYEAFFLVTEVQILIERIYIEMSVDLLYAYNLILTPLFEILTNNLGNTSNYNQTSKNFGIFIEKVYNYTLKTVETMIEINDFNVLYDVFTCEILNKYHLVLDFKVKVYKACIQPDIYKTINTRRSLIKRQKKTNPLIQMLERGIIKNRLILNEALENHISDKSRDKLESSPTSVNKISEVSPNTKNNQAKYASVKRKSNIQLFIVECELYFMEIIEKRIGAVYLFLSF